MSFCILDAVLYRSQTITRSPGDPGGPSCPAEPYQANKIGQRETQFLYGKTEPLEHVYSSSLPFSPEYEHKLKYPPAKQWLSSATDGPSSAIE